MKNSFLGALRALIAIFFIPFYTAFIFNANGVPFFVTASPNLAIGQLVVLLSPWFLPLVATLSGVYCAHFAKQNQLKKALSVYTVALFVPFVIGVFVVLPIFFYITSLNKQDNLFAVFKDFIAHLFLGFDFSFSSGPIWLLGLLFVYSLIALGIAHFMQSAKKDDAQQDKTVLRPLPWFSLYVAGAIFLLLPEHNAITISIYDTLLGFFGGFFILSDERTQEYLKTKRHFLIALWCLLEVLVALFTFTDIAQNHIFLHLANRLLVWIGTLALIALCKRYCSKPCALFEFCKNFLVLLFLFGQLAIVIFAKIILPLALSTFASFALIVLASALCMLLLYALFLRVRFFSIIFGIKESLYNEDN